MDLIERIYEEDFGKEVDGKKNISISLDNTMYLDYYLKMMNFSKRDLSYSDVMNVFGLILGNFNMGDKIILSDFKKEISRYGNKIGSVSFNINSNEKDTIKYYSCGEVFMGNSPLVSLSSDRTVVNFLIDSKNSFFISNYEILLDNGYLLNRSYLFDDMVMFNIGNNDRHFVIYVRGIKNLDNEIEFVNYLKNLEYPCDIISIYKDLCDISLANDISKYVEITLCESINKGNEWEDINLISLGNGEVVDFVISIDDKVISCDQDGNFSYKIVDSDLTISIDNNNGRECVNIVASSNKILDDYIDGLLRYDKDQSIREVERVKKLVREKITNM